MKITLARLLSMVPSGLGITYRLSAMTTLFEIAIEWFAKARETKIAKV